MEAASRIQMLEAQMQSSVKHKDDEIAKLHERIKVNEQTSKITVQPTPLVPPLMSASPSMSAFGPQPTSHLRSSVDTQSAQTRSHQPTAPLGSSSGVGSSNPEQSFYEPSSFIRNRMNIDQTRTENMEPKIFHNFGFLTGQRAGTPERNQRPPSIPRGRS